MAEQGSHRAEVARADPRAVGDVEDRASAGGVAEGGDAVHRLVARVGAVGEQILHDRRLAVGGGEDQGGRSAVHRCIHLRPGVEEEPRGRVLPLVDGVDERRPAGEAAVAPVHVGPALDEDAHGVDVSLAGGHRRERTGTFTAHVHVHGGNPSPGKGEQG